MSDSGTSTPRAFSAQAASTEDLLKVQTVGLVQLDDYRKRRRDASDAEVGNTGKLAPSTDGTVAGADGASRKKKLKKSGRKLLSFDDDNDDDKERSQAPKQSQGKTTGSLDGGPADKQHTHPEHKFKPSPHSALPAPKAMTKANLAAEATERERLKAEFAQMQELVRDSDIAIPFVFYDGANIPGGTVKVKKGEHIWLFLERCRKLGAELGVGGDGSAEGGASRRAQGKKSWARIGVDDLMMVRGETIVPHHYTYFYFIVNKVVDPTQPDRLLFNYESTATLKDRAVEQAGLLKKPKDEKLEGQDDDPNFTKVVDRRWYETSKHIYPASLWREYRADKDETETKHGRRDAQGNAFFFS